MRTPADLVDRYHSGLNNEVLTIYVDSGEPRRIAIASDGGVGVNASVRAGLVRRHGRVMLRTLWCYRWGIYWREL